MDEIVSLPVARNAMNLIARGAVNDAFEALGISKDDFELVTGDQSWIGIDRPRVTAVLNAVTHGTLDVLGLPRIEVPAEYRAACIACFVAPCNIHVACRWMESGVAAADIVAGGQLEPVSARQLFVLCCQLSGDVSVAAAAWQKRTTRAIYNAMEGTSDAPKEGKK